MCLQDPREGAQGVQRFLNPKPLTMLNGKRLRQYLAYTVLDKQTEPERKPPVKAKRATHRRGPERDVQYLAWVRTLACRACHREGRSESLTPAATAA